MHASAALMFRFAICFTLVTLGEAYGDDDGDRILASVVDEVRNAIPSAGLASWGASQAENNKWGNLVAQCKASFARLLGRSDERLLVYRFVSKFGQLGANADFSIVLALGRYGVPAKSGGASLVSTTGNGPEEVKNDVFRHNQLLAAECQTRLFLKHPERLQRYIQFLAWAGFLDQNGYSHYKRCARDSMPSSAYWCHARNALVLMASSGRSINNIHPDAVYEPFTRWLGEVSEFEIEFPDRKDLLPFPDWEGATPIPGHAFRQIFD